MTQLSDNHPQIHDGEIYRRLSSILRDTTDFSKQSSEILQVGEEFLGVDNGHITRIEPSASYWETISSSSPSEGDFPVGLTHDLEETYCRRTLERGSTIALHNAAEQGWAEDPAYNKHRLETYLGTPYLINGQSYGTVCFVSSDPRSHPFTEDEISFVEFLAEFISQTLSQIRQDEIIDEKEWVISTLCRVLRHNLSNDLNVVYSHSEMLERKSEESLHAHIDAIKSNSEDLIHLAEKARELQSLVNVEYKRSEVSLESLIDASVAPVRRSFPDAEFSIECPSDMDVYVLPYLQTALTELIENAAKHTENPAKVEITVARTHGTFSIRIVDTGVGLPTQEQKVLNEGEETPLVHGGGLGLWMVHWIVQRHDGSIQADASKNGTTIEMTIPYGTAKIPSEIEPDLNQK